MTRSINQAGLDLIKQAEGLRLHSYQDSVGVWTIGFGHTGADVHPKQMISEPEAISLLKDDLLDAEEGVTDMLRVPVNENQFAALVSFAFNLGVNALRGSRLLRMLNEGQEASEVANQFLLWDHAGGKKLKGLTLRRQAERELFLSIPQA